jgi:ribosome-associated heat shock protein Hsp15
MLESARLDRWLLAARLFKTRALAAKAIAGGRVEVNEARAKPARPIRAGDRIRVRIGPYQFLLVVKTLALRRGSAEVAGQLYDEEPASREARERIREQHRLAARMRSPEQRGRPTKRERREWEKLRARE